MHKNSFYAPRNRAGSVNINIYVDERFMMCADERFVTAERRDLAGRDGEGVFRRSAGLLLPPKP